MQNLYCWRCKMIVPMLEDDEWKTISSTQLRGRGRLQAILGRYNALTGFGETNVNAVWHHLISLYGPERKSCGKRL
jgi:hypothetical protein